ncbi:hypothetical protein AVEN_163516-1 [Araneus ventricosus]|uniref:Uncharacterized protein n=1 Tax=Araneus ventricosus TaxID=182803 RepID=A0A4Y2BSP3_ARAVE|nr:hypothetical protein AVEN_163516-1 [Araneus ventricosus]
MWCAATVIFAKRASKAPGRAIPESSFYPKEEFARFNAPNCGFCSAFWERAIGRKALTDSFWLSRLFESFPYGNEVSFHFERKFRPILVVRFNPWTYEFKLQMR